jgi:transposase
MASLSVSRRRCFAKTNSQIPSGRAALVRLYYKRFLSAERDPRLSKQRTFFETELGMEEPIINENLVEFAVFIGMDWGDREHAWVLEESSNGKRQRGKLKQTPEAIEDWAIGLAQRFAGRPIAIALEQSRGALICALSKYPYFTIFPVHPRTSSQYRTALFPSGAKDDPKDADLLLDLLVRHRDRLRRLRPDTEETRKLQVLVEERRQLVDERTAQTNRITAQMKLYFPQVLDWFDDVGSPLVRAFLQRWPTLAQVQAEPAERIREFLQGQNCRGAALNQKRLEQIASARPLTTDRAIVEPAVLLVGILLEVVKVLRDGIAALQREIEQLCATHPDYAVFASLPGAGPALAPRLLAAFGTQRDRFTHANQLQAFSGIAPVISRSGQSQWIHFRWACPKFLRQTFHEFAGVSIQQSCWARDLYDRQRAVGKSHHAALRALAFKWIRIIYRCWKDSTLYSEQHHLAAQAARQKNSSKPQAPTPPVEAAADFLFKKSAGFWKISRGTS